ncbi:PaaI family thioesterase [Phreatobacter stygius]|uniref:PaaI family thioesterase n=1 Tax=Phreatobacter stygius TaxID=1940610 RepID=UPI001FEAC960|nr:PaaI family thioesterase [Phreatobacter stygius]
MTTARSNSPLSIEQLQAKLDASPFSAFLGLKVVSADAAREEITIRAPFRPELERGAGTGQWHGGPIASVIDTVGDFALIMLIGRGLPTINFRVDYLRPAVNTALIVTAKVRRNGRSVGVSDVDVFDERGTLLAIGRASYATQDKT